MNRFLISSAILVLYFNISFSAIDTIYVNGIKDEISLIDNVYILEDKSDSLTIEEILKNDKYLNFIRNENEKLNYGLTNSAYWLKFILRNKSNTNQHYILNIANPDINEVCFYEYKDLRTSKRVETGEIENLNTREILHRNFLFNLVLEPNKTVTYFIKVHNDGESTFVPLRIFKNEYFERIDYRDQFVNGIFYGILFFILFFNLYLFKSIKDKVYLYYSLHVLFISLFLLSSDGYHIHFNSLTWAVLIKQLFPGLCAFYLIAFSQTFLESAVKWPILNKIFNILKYSSALFVILFLLHSKFFILTIIGVPAIIVLTLVLIVITSIISFNRHYMPSIFFLSAFIFMILGALIYGLREVGILASNFNTENAVRIGLSCESILLTLAVLERFRINQENAKITIEKNYEKIQHQKNQLIKVNIELEKLSLVASETDNSVAIYDDKGNIEWCNAGFERLYDVTYNELLDAGQCNIREIINYANIKKLVDYSLENKQSVVFENKIKTKKKREIWLQTTLTPYIAEQGKLNKLIAIDTDISELKLYERNLTISKDKAEESDRLKTAFLANMSHEIRTPLNGILGFGNLLKRENLSDDKRNRYLEIMDKNGQQLLKLVDDILDISLIESNQLKTHIVEFDLNNIINETYEYFQLHKRNINKDCIEIHIKKSFKENDDKMRSDPTRLKQVLTNLVDNALKFTDRGYINFGYGKVNSHLKFFVEDSGSGISDDKKKTLFKRFTQGEETLKRKHGGAGLGLSISKGIVELLGGKIWFDDDYKKGSRFYFTLPLENV